MDDTKRVTRMMQLHLRQSESVRNTLFRLCEQSNLLEHQLDKEVLLGCLTVIALHRAFG